MYEGLWNIVKYMCHHEKQLKLRYKTLETADLQAPDLHFLYLIYIILLLFSLLLLLLLRHILHTLKCVYI